VDVNPTTFRLAALLLGLAGVISTALMWRLYWVSVASGVLFGAGGWLIDWFTGFRRLGGYLSSWALAAGGAIVGFEWNSNFKFDDATTHSLWPRALQYVSVVLVCWGLLMYSRRLLPVSPDTRWSGP
jgi:hypothetical protein